MSIRVTAVLEYLMSARVCVNISDQIFENCRSTHTPVKFTFHHEWLAIPILYSFAPQPYFWFDQAAFHEWISRDVCQPLGMLWNLLMLLAS